MQVPIFIQQTDDIKSKQEVIKLAREYFGELLKSHISEKSAKQKVLERTGVVLYFFLLLKFF